MKFKRFQKSTAFALSVVCLFLAGYMMVPVGHHLMDHGKKASHSGQHSSAACAWMCASSVFSQTNSPFLKNEPLVFLFTVSLLLGTFLSHLSGNKLRARAPPL